METFMFYSYESCPSVVKQQIAKITNEVSNQLNGNLLGLYLHGSMVLGGFDEASSDIDMIGVIKDELSLKEKIALSSLLLSLNKKPRPIDIEFFIKDDFVRWQGSPASHFYFSDYWIEKYEKIALGGDDASDLLAVVNPGGEATADFKIAKENGVCLYGMPTTKLLPVISDEIFLGFISSGVNQYYVESDNDEQSSFLILQLCRILAYKQIREILSKHKAAEWALDTLPSSLHSIIRTALFTKYGFGEKTIYTKEDALSFKAHMVERINTGD